MQGSKYFQQYAPGKPGSLARPNDLPGSDLTNAFDQEQPRRARVGSLGRGTAPASSFAYGFQVHMWDINRRPRATSSATIKQAGFNWLKEQIDWDAVETAPGQYDWTSSTRS